MYCTYCGKKLEDDFIVCPYCGQKKILLQTCPALFDDQSASNEQPAPSRETPRRKDPPPTNNVPRYPKPPKNPSKGKKDIFIVYIFLIAIVVIAASICLYFVSWGEPEPESKPEPEYPIVSEPKSGQILSGSTFGYMSSITVSAAKDRSCVVKIKDENELDVLSFYVRAGDTVRVRVPSQSLYVYFASGKTWYGNEYLFGSNTRYSMDDDLLDFANYTFEYELYETSGGNFSDTPIDAEKFQ